jgi:hypothetical protein
VRKRHRHASLLLLLLLVVPLLLRDNVGGRRHWEVHHIARQAAPGEWVRGRALVSLRVEVNIRAATARRGCVDKEVSREHIDVLCDPLPSFSLLRYS